MYYGLTSLGVFILLFFLYRRIFHRQKKSAREIVFLALLSALTVVGNLLSFSVLPLQMGTALVIISGISFGPEAGFLVGSMARLVCNIFQGQGPWTPWQMISWGLLGVLAGLIFHKWERGGMKKEAAVSAFTFLAVFLLYGGIMNFCAYITSAAFVNGEGFSIEALRLMYISGIPYDFWHATRAAIAVFVLGPILIPKFERVKIKYGFYRVHR